MNCPVCSSVASITLPTIGEAKLKQENEKLRELLFIATYELPDNPFECQAFSKWNEWKNETREILKGQRKGL